MGTVPQGSTTVGALSESVGGQLSESVGVCRSCRRTIVGALSDCRNRAQVAGCNDRDFSLSKPALGGPSPRCFSDAFASHERLRLGQLTKPVATRTFGSHEASIHLFSAASPRRLRGPSEGL